MATHSYKLVNGSSAGGSLDGPNSSTDNAIARFDGTGGSTIQSSGITIDNSDNLSTGGEIYIQGVPIKATLDLLGGGTGYIFNFNATTDWGSIIGSDYQITIPQATHLKGTRPDVEVYELLSGTYSVVEVIEIVNNAGDVTIQILGIPDLRFAGKLIIQ